MIYIKTTFQHHFRQITIADPVFAIPPDTTPESSPQENDAILNLTFEDLS
jgi:hypothetical protein